MITTEEFLFLAVVLAVLCLPLALGRVRRNLFYGVRTRASLADPAVWARVNRFFGVVGLAAAGVTALLALAAPIPTTSVWMPLVILLSPFGCAIALTFAYQRQVTRGIETFQS